MNARYLTIAFAITLLWASWMFRYDMKPATPGGQGAAPGAYVIDRWTGAAYILTPSGRRELREQ